MNDFIELRRVIVIALRRWWVLALMTVLGASLGYAISRVQTPVYQATATLLIGQIFQSTSPERADIQTSEALAQTYSDIARRQPVLQGVVETLDLNVTWIDLRKRVQVEPIIGTQLLQGKVEADSPEVARTIADGVADQLILISPTNLESRKNDIVYSFITQQIQKLQERIVSGQKRIDEIESAMEGSLSSTKLAELQKEKTTLEGLITESEKNYIALSNLIGQERRPNYLSVIEKAQSSNSPIRPHVLLNTILSGGLGMILALGIIFLSEYLDDTFKLVDDLYQSEELNILGAIGIIKGNNYSEKLITHLEPFSSMIESYRKVRSKIHLTFIEHSMKSIMVTSPMPSEGKSITVANLGIALAQASIKTIIVDADLRNPVLHKIFNVENGTGLADLLDSRGTRFNKYLKNTSVQGLQLLTSGKTLQDPSERLGSERMLQILKGLEEIASVILFDSPPALLVADAMVLSTQVDGVILVIQFGKSKWSAVRQTLFDFQKANANLLGSIINQVPKTNTFAIYEKYKHLSESAGIVNNLSAAISKRRKPVRESTDLVETPASAVSKRRRLKRESPDVIESPSTSVSKIGESVRERTNLIEDPSSAAFNSHKPAWKSTDLVESFSSGEKDKELASRENEEQALIESN